MDKFSWTIFIKNIRDNQSVITLDYFEEALLTLSREDINDVFEALTSRVSRSVDDGKHTAAMLQIIWHYQ